MQQPAIGSVAQSWDLKAPTVQRLQLQPSRRFSSSVQCSHEVILCCIWKSYCFASKYRCVVCVHRPAIDCVSVASARLQLLSTYFSPRMRTRILLYHSLSHSFISSVTMKLIGPGWVNVEPVQVQRRPCVYCINCTHRILSFPNHPNRIVFLMICLQRFLECFAPRIGSTARKF